MRDNSASNGPPSVDLHLNLRCNRQQWLLPIRPLLLDGTRNPIFAAGMSQKLPRLTMYQLFRFQRRRASQRYVGVSEQTSIIYSSNKLQILPQQGKSFIDVLDEWEFVIAPIIFTAFSFFTRMYRIGLSNIVTWDEAQYVYRRSFEPSLLPHSPLT